MHIKNNEGIHRLLLEFHGNMLLASRSLHRAIVAIEDASEDADIREELAEIASLLKAGRSSLELVRFDVGNVRVRFTQIGGCDGSCRENISLKGPKDAPPSQ